MKRKLECDIALFAIGGIAYGLIEILWRKYTHWTMLITGGVCFVVLYRLFTKVVNAALWQKCIIGSGVITAIELVAGCIINIWGKMNVWDYSSMPINLCGQICALYSVLWGLLSIPIVAICNIIKKKLDF